MKLTLGIALLLSTTSLWASELKAVGRNYTFSCGHFTSVQGDLMLSYTDTALPWGSSVSFVTGWEGREGFPEKRFDWKDREEWIATATAPYTWTLKITKVLHERSHASFLDTLDFVVKVHVPERPDYFIHGNSPWGFFKVRLVEKEPGRCVSNEWDLPGFSPLPVETVDRY